MGTAACDWPGKPPRCCGVSARWRCGAIRRPCAEAGGTGVFTISDVDIALPDTVPDDALPERTWEALRTVPFAFFGMGATMLGLRWVIGRRNRMSEKGRS